jgi:acyl-CoA hydrolase
MIRFIAILFALLFAQTATAQVEIDCTFKYRLVTQTDIRICAYQPLTKGDLQFVQRTVNAVPENHARFLNLHRPAVLDRIDVAIVTHTVMNDGSLPFGLTRNKDVLGRYYPGDRRVYVVMDSIRKRDGVLAHEIAHLLNYRSGISDRDLDERLAYAFEDFLASQ